MRIDRKKLCLYAVTDRTWLGNRSLEEAVEKALLGGTTLVQYREKVLSGEAFLKEAERVKKVCDRYQVPLIINDDVSAAKEIDASGVHIGQSDMAIREARELLGEGKIIGASARTVEQAIFAEREGADYLGVGAVFGTRTKADAKTIDLLTLQTICEAVRIPVVAIGGVTEENIERLKGTGIAGVAVVSAIFKKADIASAARELRRKAELL